MNLLRHGEAGPLVIPNTVALVRGAPHQGEARELVQFLLSESVEAALARSDAHNTPVRAALAAQFPALSFDAPLAVDYDAVADAIPEAIRVATKILK
jgi:iron(III) transport system substrate-binding protein